MGPFPSSLCLLDLFQNVLSLINPNVLGHPAVGAFSWTLKSVEQLFINRNESLMKSDHEWCINWDFPDDVDTASSPAPPLIPLEKVENALHREIGCTFWNLRSQYVAEWRHFHKAGLFHAGNPLTKHRPENCGQGASLAVSGWLGL